MEPKHHLDVKDGNTQSYSCLLNGPEQLKMLSDFGQLLASIRIFNHMKLEIEKETAFDKAA